MSPTLLEGAVAVLLVFIAWRIGRLLTPLVVRWFREQFPKQKTGDKKKPPIIIDT